MTPASGSLPDWEHSSARESEAHPPFCAKFIKLFPAPRRLEAEEVARREAALWARPERVEAILDFLAASAVEHGISFRWRPFLSDPDDDFILELADWTLTAKQTQRFQYRLLVYRGSATHEQLATRFESLGGDSRRSTEARP